MSEYSKTFIGIPIPDHVQMDYSLLTFFLIEEGRFPEMRRNIFSQFPHLTLYYLGTINEQTRLSSLEAMRKNAHHLSGAKIEVGKLKIIGDTHHALVFDVRPSPQLATYRQALENDLPEFNERNYPFNPHVTVTEIRSHRSRRRARKMVLRSTALNRQFVPERIVSYSLNSILDEVNL